MFFVFEKKPNINEIKQISVGFETEEECLSFIETMKAGMNYKTIHPDYELVYAKLIFA